MCPGTQRVILIAIALVLMSGCSGHANLAQDKKGLVGYVANLESDSITSFSIDQSSGELKTLSTAPTGSSPAQLASSTDRKFLYVTNSRGGNISKYALDGLGGLQAIGSPVRLTDSNGLPYGLVAAGQFLFVGSTANAIEVFHIDGVSGNITPIEGSPFPLPSKATQLAVTHSGKFLYAFGDGADVVYCLSIDSATGRLQEISPPVHTGLDPLAARTDRSDKFLFVTTSFGQTLFSYKINADGTLQEQSRTPLEAHGALSLDTSPDNRFLFVDVFFGNNIAVFSFDASTGVVSPVRGSPFQDGQIPSSLTSTPNGEFLLVTRYSNNPGFLVTYRIDPITGALSKDMVSGITVGNSPLGVFIVGR